MQRAKSNSKMQTAEIAAGKKQSVDMYTHDSVCFDVDVGKLMRSFSGDHQNAFPNDVTSRCKLIRVQIFDEG